MYFFLHHKQEVFMKTGIIGAFIGYLVLAGGLAADAKTVYVATNSVANGPGNSWTNAFHTIQAAVSTAVDGDKIMVTNGTYNRGGAPTPGVDHYLTNRVCITSNITVQSVNGPEVTTILGAANPGTPIGPAAVRCVYIDNGALVGFTLTGGYTDEGSGLDGRGGGLETLGGLIVNCIITGNVSYEDGGGLLCKAGDGPDCTFSNCTITGNTAGGSGGGGSCEYGELIGCTIRGNLAKVSGGGIVLGSTILDGCSVTSNTAWNEGGGLFIGGGDCTIRVSTVTDNKAGEDGGGIHGGATIERCLLKGNSAQGDGGGVWSYGAALVRNTLISGNVASNVVSLSGGGGIYLGGSAGAFGTLEHCTISSNTAGLTGGGLYCSVAGQVTNCIIYFNSAKTGAANWTNVDADAAVCNYGYTCTTPISGLPGGHACFTNDPKFLNRAIGDYHLRYGSPCIDAGYNLTGRGLTDDLAGVSRPLDGNADGTSNFDLGCYEYVMQTTDSDGDGMNDADEIVAATDPIDPASYFRIVTVSNVPPYCRVYFNSVTNRNYTLEYRSSLIAGNWTNAPGQTNVLGTGALFWLSQTNTAPIQFYRLKVQEP